MRRCLQQKIEIRREFYSGICWVTSKNKPLLTTVTETLLQQFRLVCLSTYQIYQFTYIHHVYKMFSIHTRIN